MIEIFIEENQDFPYKKINKLFENEETENENIKIIENLQSTISSLQIELERYKNKIEILLKENERMIKEEKELYRLMEQKYILYK